MMMTRRTLQLLQADLKRRIALVCRKDEKLVGSDVERELLGLFQKLQEYVGALKQFSSSDHFEPITEVYLPILRERTLYCLIRGASAFRRGFLNLIEDKLEEHYELLSSEFRKKTSRDHPCDTNFLFLLIDNITRSGSKRPEQVDAETEVLLKDILIYEFGFSQAERGIHRIDTLPQAVYSASQMAALFILNEGGWISLSEEVIEDLLKIQSRFIPRRADDVYIFFNKYLQGNALFQIQNYAVFSGLIEGIEGANVKQLFETIFARVSRESGVILQSGEVNPMVEPLKKSLGDTPFFFVRAEEEPPKDLDVLAESRGHTPRVLYRLQKEMSENALAITACAFTLAVFQSRRIFLPARQLELMWQILKANVGSKALQPYRDFSTAVFYLHGFWFVTRNLIEAQACAQKVIRSPCASVMMQGAAGQLLALVRQKRRDPISAEDEASDVSDGKRVCAHRETPGL